MTVLLQRFPPQVLGLVAGLALLAAGCAPAAAPASTPAAGPPAASKATGAAAPGAATAPSATAAPVAGPSKVRVGVLSGNIAYAPFFIAEARGYFREQGLEVELVGFRSGNDMVAPLATNEIQGGGLSPGPPFYNALGRGISFVLVGDTGSLPPGYSSQALIIRKDLIDSGRFTDYKDLKGLTVALPTRNAANEFNLRKALAKGGLTIADVKIVQLAYTDMNVAMSNRSIDAAISSEPAIAIGLEQGLFTRWKGADEFYPYHQIGGLAYNAEFARTETAKKLYVAFIKGTRDYNDAFVKKTNRQEMVDLLTKWTSLQDAAMYDKMHFQGLDPNGRISVDSLKENFLILKAEGLVDVQDADFGKIVDTSFSEYAIKQLGEYK
ncbi:MAG: ABC transporter substrate-binding protein [Planctomycetes bacterium]|nr:ABC transporter substrate-binding protein [Planctomycetota bacterium]